MTCVRCLQRIGKLLQPVDSPILEKTSPSLELKLDPACGNSNLTANLINIKPCPSESRIEAHAPNPPFTLRSRR